MNINRALIIRKGIQTATHVWEVWPNGHPPAKEIKRINIRNTSRFLHNRILFTTGHSATTCEVS